MSRILVTGGTGDLGSKIVTRLDGHTVRVMSRSARPSNYDPSKEWAKADLAAGKGIAEAVQGVDVIVHAASNPFGNMVESDINGTRRLLDAAKQAGVRHFVFISIIGIERIPFFYYKAKLQLEQMVEQSGIPFTISRAAQFHSFVDRVLRAVDRLPLILPFPTAMQFQTIDTGEYADYLVPYITAPAAGGCIPDAAGPKVMRAGEMARLWLKARGERKLILPLPARGGLATGFRKGYNTAPHRAVGKITFERWLETTYGGKSK
jgi:uncharacterized protein YbjT (DUF2867 family)